MKLTGKATKFESIVVGDPRLPMMESHLLDAEECPSPLQMTIFTDMVRWKEAFLDIPNLSVKTRRLRILIAHGNLVWLNEKGVPRHRKLLHRAEYPICTDSMYLYIGRESTFPHGEGIMCASEGCVGSIYEYKVPKSGAGKQVQGEYLDEGWYATLIEVYPPYATEEYLIGYLRRNFPVEGLLEPMCPGDGILL